MQRMIGSSSWHSSFALLLLVGALVGYAAGTEPVSRADPLNKRLLVPMVSVIEGQSLRDALQQVTERAGVKWWLDRRVDPTAPIDVGQVGPNVYAALEAIAASRDCQVMPLNDVVLIGRPSWLDQVTASLLKLSADERDHRQSEPVDVRWDELTTPSEALALAAGATPDDLGDAKLPHDLWPAVDWPQIDRRVAVTLVLAQFDKRLPDGAAIGAGNRILPIAADRRGRFERRYAAGPNPVSFRAAIRSADQSADVVRERTSVVVTATAAGHRAATAVLLKEHAPAAAVANDAATFSLTLKNKPAGVVLEQLASAAEKVCEIAPSAVTACRQLVSLEATDVTLEELAQRVADQAGVQVDWGAKQVVVTARQ